jgi:hypothetical protein
MNRLCVLNTGWKSDSLQLMIFVNVSSTWNNFELRTCFETWITRNVVNGVSLFYLYYLITLMAYLCSQWTPNFQIKYFMLDWSIYKLFVLNSARKRDSLQIMTFVYVCSTRNLVERKTRSDTWMTRNDVNIVSMYHISYLITLMCYLKS